MGSHRVMAYPVFSKKRLSCQEFRSKSHAQLSSVSTHAAGLDKLERVGALQESGLREVAEASLWQKVKIDKSTSWYGTLRYICEIRNSIPADLETCHI